MYVSNDLSHFLLHSCKESNLFVNITNLFLVFDGITAKFSNSIKIIVLMAYDY